MLPALIT